MNYETREKWIASQQWLAQTISAGTNGAGLLNVPFSVSGPLMQKIGVALRADRAGVGIPVGNPPDDVEFSQHYYFCNMLAMTANDYAVMIFGGIVDSQPMSFLKRMMLMPQPVNPALPLAEQAELSAILFRAYMQGNRQDVARIASINPEAWAKILSVGGLYPDPKIVRSRFNQLLINVPQYVDPVVYTLGMMLLESRGPALQVKPPPTLNLLQDVRNGNRYAQNLLRYYKAVIAQNDKALTGATLANGTPVYVPRYSNPSKEGLDDYVDAYLSVGAAMTVIVAAVVAWPLVAASLPELSAATLTDLAVNKAKEEATEKIQGEVKEAVADAIAPSPRGAGPGNVPVTAQPSQTADGVIQPAKPAFPLIPVAGLLALFLS